MRRRKIYALLMAAAGIFLLTGPAGWVTRHISLFAAIPIYVGSFVLMFLGGRRLRDAERARE